MGGDKFGDDVRGWRVGTGSNTEEKYFMYLLLKKSS